jgi:hypothetical protein
MLGSLTLSKTIKMIKKFWTLHFVNNIDYTDHSIKKHAIGWIFFSKLYKVAFDKVIFKKVIKLLFQYCDHSRSYFWQSD